MRETSLVFKAEQRPAHIIGWGDIVVLIGIAVALYAGLHFARDVSAVIHGPKISLSPKMLPYYTLLSLGRMLAAYGLSLVFTLVYGYLAAYNRHAERVLLPILDVLQSVPILSFLPVVLLSFSAVLPRNIAPELASIVLIFTSQVWNMTFAWYQSLITIPTELRQVTTTFHFSSLLRFKALELPFAAITLIWNSVMSWAGGWFFLMAAEIFNVGKRDFRLQGLGAYLAEAANQGDGKAIIWGIGTLIFVIVVLDQLVWRPLLAWSDRFKLEMVERDIPPSSWFYDTLRDSRLLEGFRKRIYRPASDFVETAIPRFFHLDYERTKAEGDRSWVIYLFLVPCAMAFLYGAYRAGLMLRELPLVQWSRVVTGVAVTLLRVYAALAIAFAWTVPLGVAIGTNRRAALILQPVVQIAASLPATAIFPVFLLFMLRLPGGLNFAAVLLMLMGTQWYLLFNVIAGAAFIPQDLKYSSVLLHLKRWDRWRTLVLPALFPYMITGAIAAGGGAWNASIVAEYVQFGGKVYSTTGIGALIAEATASADYPLLLASTLCMIVTVVSINRFGWRRLYRLARERYRMES
jgi:NitT/TauT family transport system permease protein